MATESKELVAVPEHSHDLIVSEKQDTPMRPIVLCGPSAVGKGTLTQLLFNKLGDHFGKKVSTTTRAPRQGEINGTHYHFVDHNTFDTLVDNGAFIEVARVHTNKYGTTFQSVREAAQGGKIPLLELDTQGVKTVNDLCDDNGNDDSNTIIQPNNKLNAIFIWIAPPTKDTLMERLQSRGSETDDEIKQRLATAELEFKFFEQYKSVFNHILINDGLHHAFDQLLLILAHEYPHLRPYIPDAFYHPDNAVIIHNPPDTQLHLDDSDHRKKHGKHYHAKMTVTTTDTTTTTVTKDPNTQVETTTTTTTHTTTTEKELDIQ